MAFAAGRLRDLVRIEQLVSPVDSHGDPLRGNQGQLIDQVWTPIATVPACIEYLSAREFIQSAETQSRVTARIVIRFREGMTAALRLVQIKDGSDYKIFNPEGFLPDKDCGREYLTSPVSEGVNTGE